MQLYRILIVSMALVLTACASEQQQSEHSSNVVWDNQQGLWIAPDALNKKLEDSQYVIIGELNRTPKMRHQLLDILDHLRSYNSLQVVYVDAFKSNTSSDSPSFSDHFESVPESLVDYYRPVILWADQHGVILRGAATPLEKLKSTKFPEGQEWVEQRTKGVLSKQKQQKLLEILEQSHQSQTEQPEKNQYLLAAHKLNDDFMARLMVSTRQNTLLLTRAFHARTDLGVEPYIMNLKPGSKTISILMLGTKNNQQPPNDLINELKSHYDFIWLQKPETNFLPAPKGQADHPNTTEQQ